MPNCRASAREAAWSTSAIVKIVYLAAGFVYNVAGKGLPLTFLGYPCLPLGPLGRVTSE